MTAYTIIDCGLHSEFELAIMHAHRLQLSWKLPGEPPVQQQVKPINLCTENHEEFLLIEDEEGRHLKIRLDYINGQPFGY